MAIAFLTLSIGNQFLSDEKALTRDQVGHDFTAFYTGGSFVRQGRADLLYNVDAVRDFEHATWRREGYPPNDAFGPWWNPPFYAWVFVPLAGMTLRTAIAVWTCITLACLAISIVILCRMLAARRGPLDRPITFKDWGLVPLLVMVSMPFIQASTHAQNSFTSLLFLTITVWAWRSGKGFAAGLVSGLLFYKPQLGAVVAGMLVLNMGWPALLGVGLTGIGLLLINVITLPGTLTNYLHRLPTILHYMQVELPYIWERHATIKAFWRLLLQGKGAGAPYPIVTILTLLMAGSLLSGLLVAVWRTGIGLRWPTGLTEDRSTILPFRPAAPIQRQLPDSLIIATILCMPLLMPFYFDYDLMLLAVPAVLFAGQRLRETTTRCSDRWLARAWITLFAWMLINPGFAARTSVNLSVPLLAIVAALSIFRATRQATAITTALHTPATRPGAIAA